MSMASLNVMVLRIPMNEHKKETYWPTTQEELYKTISNLENDKNVLEFYII